MEGNRSVLFPRFRFFLHLFPSLKGFLKLTVPLNTEEEGKDRRELRCETVLFLSPEIASVKPLLLVTPLV